MATIETLPSTTISGRRFTREQLRRIQETVRMFPNLSRKELARTICEHLDWKTPAGRLKVDSGLTLLEHLEKWGIVTLPEKQKRSKHNRRVPSFENPPDQSPIEGTIDDVGPIRLQRVSSEEDFESFKAYIQTFHYLGYRQPFGSYIGYFIVSEPEQRKLGCFLFSASAAWALKPRDQWIGWEKKHRQKLLHLIISNDRFLIFPWVQIPNLASHVLSLATKQVGDDWVDVYKYRPVLIETFVDTSKYRGTSYRSANWVYLGHTQGRGFDDPKCERKATIKEIFVYPLTPDWRETLTSFHRESTLKKKYRNDLQTSRTRVVDDSFVALWENVAQIIYEVADQYDKKWQIRNRLINSFLIILFVFRLVCSKNAQSYGTTIDELWDNCRKLKLPLVQKNSVVQSSICAARGKLDEAAFRDINRKIIETYSEQPNSESHKWLGHRIFAVDGSRINLPRRLLRDGYRVLCGSSYYPQGLLSCLYQLKSQIPFDFDLVSHLDERACAEQHLKTLETGDVVVYDRGYYSYLLLNRHFESKIHAVFRLPRSSSPTIDEFFSSTETDTIVSIYPSSTTRREILAQRQDVDFVQISMRLVKYEINGETICLGTTLLDQSRYTKQDLIDLYQSRWGIEELYKISKRIFIIEDFHARNERGVKQEIFAHFVLITMNRIFANQAETDLNSSSDSGNHVEIPLVSVQPSFDQQVGRIKINFKSCINAFTRGIEELLVLSSNMKAAIEGAFMFIKRRCQKERPGRSYKRISMRPVTKWHAPRKRKKKNKSPNPLTTLNPAVS